MGYVTGPEMALAPGGPAGAAPTSPSPHPPWEPQGPWPSWSGSSSNTCHLPDCGFHIPELGLAHNFHQSLVPRTHWAQFLRIGLSGRRPAPLPPSCFEAAHNHPRQGCWVMWSGGFHVTLPSSSAAPPGHSHLVCAKNTHFPGPRAPTFIRSSAFTLLPWISSMQKGCSRDHRDIEEGWAAGGETRLLEQIQRLGGS